MECEWGCLDQELRMRDEPRFEKASRFVERDGQRPCEEVRRSGLDRERKLLLVAE